MNARIGEVMNPEDPALGVSNLQTAMGATEKKALDLLGANWGPELVAQTLGVSVSRVSQFLADPVFAAAVQEKRFQALQKHTDHDNRLDRMEHKIAENLERSISFMMKPADQMRALETLNRLKRRGTVDSGTNEATSNVVTLLMPTFVTQKFTTNINNQVIQAGGQILETIQSSTLMRQAKEQIIDQQQKLIEANGIERSSDELTRYKELGESAAARIAEIGREAGASPDDF